MAPSIFAHPYPGSEKDIDGKEFSSVVAFFLPGTRTLTLSVVGPSLPRTGIVGECKESKGLVMRLSLEMCLRCPVKRSAKSEMSCWHCPVW